MRPKSLKSFAVVEIIGDGMDKDWEKVLYVSKTVSGAEKYAWKKRKELEKAGKDPTVILVRML